MKLARQVMICSTQTKTQSVNQSILNRIAVINVLQLQAMIKHLKVVGLKQKKNYRNVVRKRIWLAIVTRRRAAP